MLFSVKYIYQGTIKIQTERKQHISQNRVLNFHLLSKNVTHNLEETV